MIKRLLGDLLVEAGLLNAEQMERALAIQKKSGKKLGEVLIEEKIIEEKQIIEVLEFQLGIPHVDLEKYEIDPQIPRLITEALAKRHLLIPVKKVRGRLLVAMADPLNIFAIDDVKISTGFEIDPVIATRSDIVNAIDFFYGKENAEKAAEEFRRQFKPMLAKEVEADILNEVNDAPLVRLVNSIIKQAVKAKASDIHIEPFNEHVRIRFRVDGDLQEIMTPAKSTHSAMITRIKIMSQMDIAEKRIPQDGRVEMAVDGREIDLRISILPTVHGEKAVIRILDKGGFGLTKNELGFTGANLTNFNNIIKHPNGIILTTGPTGSGKTTTLYVILKELNKADRNIITVEDPVEYRLQGVNQVQVNNKAGLTFANGLRSILRQDPDIIMIGEIRDSETAQIAVRASITGHLVLSTMHTNDTASTVTRLVDMEIEPYLVASSLVGVIAQRLVKRICEGCKTAYISTEEENRLLRLKEPATFFRGTGCTACNQTGYRGRTAIHEVLPITRQIRQLIDQKASIDDIRDAAAAEGMVTLRESCIELVRSGVTTVEELIKLTFSLE